MNAFRQHLPITRRFLKLQTLVTNSPFSSSSSIDEATCSSADRKIDMNLTQDELRKINLLIPRLCLYSHLSTAIQLLDAALLTSPALQSISLSVLIDSIASESDMVHSMSLLTRLKHHRNCNLYLSPIITMLLYSYCKRQKSKEVLKVYNWMVRPGSPCKPDEKVYRIIIPELCKNRMVPDALRVLRNMIDSNLIPDGGLSNCVFRCLLREAMISEAMELNEALGCMGDGDESDGLKEASTLLDRIITNWIE